MGAGELIEQLRAMAVLEENLSLSPQTHVAARNPL